MSRVSATQVVFARGLISDLAASRVDLAQRNAGLRTLENAFVRRTGVVSRREGTEYLGELPVGVTEARLIPFQFSTTQAYILEVNSTNMRVWKDRALVESSPGTPYSVAHGYTNTTPLRWVQSNDVLFVVNGTDLPTRIVRVLDTNWTFTTYILIDGPFNTETASNPTGISLSWSTGSGSETITASNTLWTSTDVGRLVRIEVSSNWYSLRITAVASGTAATGAWQIAPTASGSSSTWRLGTFYQGNTPRLVSFYGQRLVYASTPQEPNTVWFSRAGEYDWFSEDDRAGTVRDDDAITATLDSDQVNKIEWVVPLRRLMVGTSEREWSIGTSRDDEPLTPATVTARQIGTRGAKFVAAVPVGEDVLYVQRAGKRLMRLSYDLSSDAQRSADLTLLAENATADAINEIAWVQEPGDQLWCRLNSGDLACMTYVPDQELVGWSTHKIAGGTGGEANVQSIASIPAPDGNSDDLYLLVGRTIDSSAVYYVEYMPAIRDGQAYEERPMMDSAIRAQDSTAFTTITGLDHLEGETVTVVGDGDVIGTYTVDTGEIEIDEAVNDAWVGLSYTATVETLQFDGAVADGNAPGASFGKRTTITDVTLGLYDTGEGLKAGVVTQPFTKATQAPTMRPIPLRSNQAMGSSVSPLTGWVNVKTLGTSDGVALRITQEQPRPFTLTGVAMKLDTAEG